MREFCEFHGGIRVPLSVGCCNARIAGRSQSHASLTKIVGERNDAEIGIVGDPEITRVHRCGFDGEGAARRGPRYSMQSRAAAVRAITL